MTPSLFSGAESLESATSASSKNLEKANVKASSLLKQEFRDVFYKFFCDSDTLVNLRTTILNEGTEGVNGCDLLVKR